MNTRYYIAVSVALMATLGLLLLMQTLIASAQGKPGAGRMRHELGFARVIEDTQVRELPLRHHSLPPEIFPPGLPETGETTPGERIAVPLSVQPPGQPGNELSPAFGVSDGPLTTVLRVEPAYPKAAERRELEGWVVVEFDVTSSGTVENARVIGSSHAIFEAAALRAVARFRYRPKVVDGVPLPTRGLRNRFSFTMERG